MDFGVFVEILPGKDALVHVSELAKERVEVVADAFKPGDIMDVKLVEVRIACVGRLLKILFCVILCCVMGYP